MQIERRRALAALLFLTTACASIPSLPRGSSAGTDIPTPAASALPTATLRPIVAQSISQIPLHVGFGARGSWFEIYFTDPASPASDQANGGLDVPLVQAIEDARLSVHLAVYSLTLNSVRNALIRAHQRGLDIRMVTESDNLDSEDLQRLVDVGIAVLGDRREGSMHDKFMVIDGNQVWTGSMNYTASGAYQDNNNLMRIWSPEMAANYEAEFAEMFDDDTFGPSAGRPTPNPRLVIDGTLIETYFSPEDGVEDALVNLLDTAQSSIRFMAFSFTSNPLGEAVRRAARAGVEVRGLMDEDQGVGNLGSELVGFRTAGLDVRLDGNPGQMQHKVIIIDEQVVVLGSYNFSRNASESNDENVLVIHNHVIAQQFAAEFERLFLPSRR